MNKQHSNKEIVLSTGVDCYDLRGTCVGESSSSKLDGVHAQSRVEETSPSLLSDLYQLDNASCNLNKSETWIDSTLIPTALKLGVTSNRGQHFVESMEKLTGDKSNHENSKSVLNEDDMEKQNYEDSNLILGKDCVPYGD
ncbi:hypothetical protein FRX31_007923 [Thalictrum thalictroides]|uniref:Uncharacterized protein n=1 Tax=Thalictrum thalictroides TaxID=46969 RepID=A0A7J6WYH4_THATH|nr:hypothetical protein FRX31_007923 [Thalictrum thalictroides]